MDDRQRDSVTISAKTVNEAIAEAEQRLGLPREQLDITVISEGSKGFLGMGAENARILAVPRALLDRHLGVPSRPAPIPPTSDTPDDEEDDDYLDEGDEFEQEEDEEEEYLEDEDDEEEPQISAPAPAPPILRAVAPQATDQDEFDDEGRPRPPRPSDAEIAAVAEDVLRALLSRMSIPATVSVRESAEIITLDIAGDNLGLLIGRHGDTLAALQYLVNVIVGRRTRHWSKIVIDVENYRGRREDTLRSLAMRQADRVRRYRKEISLDYMPARERRIIHLALQDHPEVATYSVGDEPYRRVVIAPRRG